MAVERSLALVVGRMAVEKCLVVGKLAVVRGLVASGDVGVVKAVIVGVTVTVPTSQHLSPIVSKISLFSSSNSFSLRSL